MGCKEPRAKSQEASLMVCNGRLLTSDFFGMCLHLPLNSCLIGSITISSELLSR